MMSTDQKHNWSCSLHISVLCLFCTQPLADNLESQTYEIFEKDPVKYTSHQKAVFEALKDRVPDSDKDTKSNCSYMYNVHH